MSDELEGVLTPEVSTESAHSFDLLRLGMKFHFSLSLHPSLDVNIIHLSSHQVILPLFPFHIIKHSVDHCLNGVVLIIKPNTRLAVDVGVELTAE